MQIKKGDNVIVSKGKDAGKKGKVLRALPSVNKILIDGVNVRKKRQRARRSNEKGQTLEMPFPIDASNVLIFCTSCNQGTRMKSEMNKTKKLRVCTKCGKEM